MQDHDCIIKLIKVHWLELWNIPNSEFRFAKDVSNIPRILATMKCSKEPSKLSIRQRFSPIFLSWCSSRSFQLSLSLSLFLLLLTLPFLWSTEHLNSGRIGLPNFLQIKFLESANFENLQNFVQLEKIFRSLKCQITTAQSFSKVLLLRQIIEKADYA